MSVDVDISKPSEEHGEPIPFAPPKRRRWRRGPRGPERPPKPRLRKLRLLFVLAGLGALAFISTIFGMMMAVASDLPQIENRAVYKKAANSYLYDDRWRPIGIFAPPNNAVIDSFPQVSPFMRRRDRRGRGQAVLDGPRGRHPRDRPRLPRRRDRRPRQGASTIAEQFVKNALAEEDNRTIFEKLSEAALAYQLTREWPKKKILHGVPELDLLRERRLRHRVRSPRLLR